VLNFQVLQSQEDKEIVGHVNLIRWFLNRLQQKA
jgi:hypothetical protein